MGAPVAFPVLTVFRYTTTIYILIPLKITLFIMVVIMAFMVIGQPAVGATISSPAQLMALEITLVRALPPLIIALIIILTIIPISHRGLVRLPRIPCLLIRMEPIIF